MSKNILDNLTTAKYFVTNKIKILDRIGYDFSLALKCYLIFKICNLLTVTLLHKRDLKFKALGLS